MHDSTEVWAILLNDPVRAVRIESGEVLAGLPVKRFSELSAALDHARNEYIAALTLDAERPEAMNLGLLFAREWKPDRAEAELKTALSLDPSFSPAAVNLAGVDRDSAVMRTARLCFVRL